MVNESIASFDKILSTGLQWHVEQNTFSIKTNFNDKVTTKRNIL